ncbi:MAG: 50S ribosomal protein L6 [Patescibacteria group bacterium]|jgi:large subunit ribosomal protein L6
MSRIGRASILIPEDATVTIDGAKVMVKGPKGELTTVIRPEIKASVKDKEVMFTEEVQTDESDAYWGLARALVSNMIDGVTKGFEKRLKIVGVGYRASQKGNGVSMAIGYSHQIDFDPPQGIKIAVEDNQTLIITGADKNLVGLTAAKVRDIRGPEPYKGKGIQYENEVIRRKSGKSGKV